MLVLRWALTFVLSAGLLATRLSGAEAEPDFASKLAPVPPCAALAAAARAKQIPLEGIEPPGEAGRVDAGDSVTALVTLCEKHARRTQWLLYLEAVAPGPKDQSLKPAKPTVLYSGCGHKLEFASCPTPVTLHTIGPFLAAPAGRKPPKSQDASDRFNLDKGYLGLGLDRAAAALYRFKDTNTDALFWFSEKAPTPAEVSKNRALTDSMPISAEEERAFGGLAPALISYFGIVEHTKGLEGILLEVVDKPSLWSLMWHLGVTARLTLQQKEIRPADVASWGLPDHPRAYLLPMRLFLNDHRALDITFVVEAPRPPLLACGGIIGFLAEKPGDKETYLTLRVISARRHGSSP